MTSTTPDQQTTRDLDENGIHVVEDGPHQVQTRGEKSKDVQEDDAVSVSESARGNNLPDGYYYSLNFIGTWLSFVLGQIFVFLYGLGGGAILFNVVNLDIGPNAMISWFSIGRTMAQAIGFILVGRLSDIFGRRWMFIMGNFIAMVGSIITATATSVGPLVAGSVIVGVGEAVQNSFVVALAELVKNKHRPIIISSVYAVASPFTAFSPIIATTMIVSAGISWRWLFWLCTIVSGVGTLLTFLCYHPPHYDQLHATKTMRQQLRELDYVGILAYMAGLTLLLLPISWGGSMYPWNHAATISTLVLGVVILVALYFWEERLRTTPLLPTKFLRNVGFMSIVGCAAAGACVYFPATVLWPQQVARQYRVTGTQLGWDSCTVGAATSLGTSMAGPIIRLIRGRTRGFLIVASVGMVALIAGLAGQGRDTKSLGIALTILGPFFTGLVESSALGLAPLFCPPQDLGVAAGMLGTIRSAVASIATAVYFSIYNSRLASGIPRVVIPVAEAAGLPADSMPALLAAAAAASGSGNYRAVRGMTPALAAAVDDALPDAYVDAFRVLYLSSIAFGSLAIAGALLSSSARTRLNDTVSRKLQGKNPHVTRAAEVKEGHREEMEQKETV